MKNEKGITLIALIVTIVILLIIASVTISSIVSDEGILKHASSEKNRVTGGLVNLNDKIGALNQEGAPNIPDPPIENTTTPSGTTNTTGNKTNTIGNKTNTTGNKTNTTPSSGTTNSI